MLTSSPEISHFKEGVNIPNEQPQSSPDPEGSEICCREIFLNVQGTSGNAN